MHFTNTPDDIDHKETRDKVATIEEKLNETTALPDQEDMPAGRFGELNSCVDLEKFYHLEKEYSI